jgi:transcriptional regulator with XRE-family HTH domain
MPPFSTRLELVLKALSLSRGRLAAELGVDKSLVGRWVSGAVRPSAYNMERLTRLVATRRAEFTLLDWEREPEDLAALLGVAYLPPTSDHDPWTSLSLPGLAMARLITEHRGAVYEGFWRTTRPAVIAPGRFCRDHGLVRRGAGGLLELRLGNPDFRFSGSILPFEGQLFVIVSDVGGTMPSFLILNGASMPKPTLLDGLILTAFNAIRVPAAYPIVLERIGDLSGDDTADDAAASDLMDRHEQFLADEAVPAVLRDHLLRDVGPAAAARGGDLLLTASLTSSLARLLADQASPSKCPMETNGPREPAHAG